MAEKLDMTELKKMVKAQTKKHGPRCSICSRPDLRRAVDQLLREGGFQYTAMARALRAKGFEDVTVSKIYSHRDNHFKA
jgi:hypothetical protein